MGWGGATQFPRACAVGGAQNVAGERREGSAPQKEGRPMGAGFFVFKAEMETEVERWTDTEQEPRR